MAYDSNQLDLFVGTDGQVEQAAQRATQKRRSKLPVHAPTQEPSHSCLPFEAQRSTDRDETTVLRFPVDRWAPRLWSHKVEKVARLLEQRKTERGRQNLWTSTVNSLFAQMHRRGANGTEIEQQIDAFHHAVSWQLSDQQSGPGAA